MMRFSITILLLTSIYSYSFGQLYLGLGRNRTFAHKFNDQDVNWSYVDPYGLPKTKSYLENKHYNFWAPFVGYRRVEGKNFHDFRFEISKVGARSLLDKQDFLFDPISLELAAKNLVSSGPSRYIEFGVIHHLMKLKYGYGRFFNNYLSLNVFAQFEYTYNKLITMNWYDARDDYRLYEYRLYQGDFFPKNDENTVFGKSADYNLSIGLNGAVHLGKYFAINFEIAQNIFPSVYKGSKPSNDDYIYWETNEYFTALQVSLLTYFSKK